MPMFGENDNYELRMKALGFEELYFQDMTFQDEGYAPETEDVPSGISEALDHYTFAVAPLPDGVAGWFEEEKETLTIDNDSEQDDHVLLHEMIHLYEYNLGRFDSELFHDKVLWGLYCKLSKRLPGLNAMIDQYMRTDNIIALREAGGTHSLLFFLKSIDIDLEKGWPLYTTFGYDLEKRLEGPEENPV